MAVGRGTFFPRTDALLETVGNGDLKGVTVVDQVYAWNQHEGRWIDFIGRYGPKKIDSHPQGGGPPPSKFLEKPLFARSDEFMQRLADHVLDGTLGLEMAAVHEDLAQEVFDRAPEYSGRLKNSASPRVYDEGVEIYNRPARAPRKVGGEPFEGVPEGYYD